MSTQKLCEVVKRLGAPTKPSDLWVHRSLCAHRIMGHRISYYKDDTIAAVQIDCKSCLDILVDEFKIPRRVLLKDYSYGHMYTYCTYSAKDLREFYFVFAAADFQDNCATTADNPAKLRLNRDVTLIIRKFLGILIAADFDMIVSQSFPPDYSIWWNACKPIPFFTVYIVMDDIINWMHKQGTLRVDIRAMKTPCCRHGNGCVYQDWDDHGRLTRVRVYCEVCSKELAETGVIHRAIFAGMPKLSLRVDCEPIEPPTLNILLLCSVYMTASCAARHLFIDDVATSINLRILAACKEEINDLFESWNQKGDYFLCATN